MNHRFTLAAGLATLVGVGLVVAKPDQTGPPADRPPPPLVAALDADADGVISADEIENATAALLTLDADGDGALAPEEFHRACARGGPGPGHGRRIMNQDADEDGVVSKAEFLAHVEEMFGRFDVDGNGEITADDRAALEDTGPPFGRRVMRHDADGDGVVTLAEFTEHADTKFARLDTNGDDQIDEDEAKAATQGRRGKRGAGAWGFGHGR